MARIVIHLTRNELNDVGDAFATLVAGPDNVLTQGEKDALVQSRVKAFIEDVVVQVKWEKLRRAVPKPAAPQTTVEVDTAT